MLGRSHNYVTDLPRPPLSLTLRVTTLVPLLFYYVNSSVGQRGYGRVGDDGSLSPLPPPRA